MLVDQKVYIDGEKKVHVVNKFDHSVAAEVARMTEQEGGGRAVGKDGFEVRVGHVLPHRLRRRRGPALRADEHQAQARPRSVRDRPQCDVQAQRAQPRPRRDVCRGSQ